VGNNKYVTFPKIYSNTNIRALSNLIRNNLVGSSYKDAINNDSRLAIDILNSAIEEASKRSIQFN